MTFSTFRLGSQLNLYKHSINHDKPTRFHDITSQFYDTFNSFFFWVQKISKFHEIAQIVDSSQHVFRSYLESQQGGYTFKYALQNALEELVCTHFNMNAHRYVYKNARAVSV